MKNQGFRERFIEACGTSKPAKIQRLLNISYQAAKNYVGGRLPSTEVLLTISERTPYSIDWLLTGRGKKFADPAVIADTPLPTGQMETFVRQICVEVINEMTAQHEPAQRKVVVLQSSEVLSEKAAGEPVTLTRKRD
jgi:hypothetical protein